jgi:hypothetical protein
MSASTPQRLSHAERMDRIAELFRGGANPNATNGNDAPRRASMTNADRATPPPADTGALCAPGTRDGFRKALPGSAGKSHHGHSDFSHLHRSLAKGEPIPRAPGLLEQISVLSQLLAQRPLSQQEDEALRGEEREVEPGDGPTETRAQACPEDEAFA